MVIIQVCLRLRGCLRPLGAARTRRVARQLFQLEQCACAPQEKKQQMVIMQVTAEVQAVRCVGSGCGDRLGERPDPTMFNIVSVDSMITTGFIVKRPIDGQ